MRGIVLTLLLIAFSIGDVASVNAAGYCPSQQNGKCPTPRKISKKRSDYSEQQREKFMEQARGICRKKYGASSRVYKLDYAKWTVICTQPGY